MKKILIIEDDPKIALLERDYLAVNDFEAELAETGDEGIRMAQAGQYDLILLDLMLPGADGFTVCRNLRQTLDIPILMVTAKKGDIDLFKGLALGRRLITKTFFPMCYCSYQANLAHFVRLFEVIPARAINRRKYRLAISFQINSPCFCGDKMWS
jgi:CheY-like chemotaxis protein